MTNCTVQLVACHRKYWSFKENDRDHSGKMGQLGGLG